ncbi:MAG: gamma-glutamyltransferase [Anaerolineae bacterium]|nr:MAG: gamma-glutamyltransferase [Anaerolineae bacterium]
MKTFLRILKMLGLGLLGLIGLALVVYALLPKGPRDLMEYTDRTGTQKPLFIGQEYAIVAGTPWSAEAGKEVLEKGGTACDAAVAALLTLNVTHGEAASFPGVAPMLYYNAQTGEVKSYIGAGKAPLAATIEKFKAAGYETVPDFHIWAQLVPASPDVIVALLNECGTMSFSELAAPAIQIAREGFPIHAIMYRNLQFSPLEQIGFSLLMPETARVYLQGEFWRPIHLHDRMKFPDLANTLQALANAEQTVLAAGGTRQQGYQAVRDYFYKGPIAQAIAEMHRKQGGLMTYEDLATYSGGWETPLRGSYGPYTFYGNGTWSQGIMEPLVLQILEGLDLKSMGHNSPQYIHTVTQAIELAFADREAYIADPDFVNVPLDILLSKEYAAERRKMMTDRAFGKLPTAGEIPGFQATSAQPENPVTNLTSALFANTHTGQDTSQLVVLDQYGNSVVMTPSDFPKSPMVPGLGLTLGDRMNQFRLDPTHVNSLQPGKRPRITPHAVIVFKDGKYFMSYSTPGGDMQAQALVQVFLNMAVFGMDIQQAVSAPRFYSISAPSSFAPHEYTVGGLRLEPPLAEQVSEALAALGYNIQVNPQYPLDKDFGAVGAIHIGADGLIYAGADPREETTAAGK